MLRAGQILRQKLTGYMRMRSSRGIERLTVNANFATVLGSISASYDTVESEGRQMKQC
jgi:hypothetical protein